MSQAPCVRRLIWPEKKSPRVEKGMSVRNSERWKSQELKKQCLPGKEDPKRRTGEGSPAYHIDEHG